MKARVTVTLKSGILDPQGKATGSDDVFTRVEKARAHYTAVGLGEAYVDQFIHGRAEGPIKLDVRAA